MTPFASLPMYNFPEMRSANAQFWGALRGLLLEAGLGDVPETLVFERGPVPARLGARPSNSQQADFLKFYCQMAASSRRNPTILPGRVHHSFFIGITRTGS
jgi:hypothetical protein